jgi:hypothetical protein
MFHFKKQQQKRVSGDDNIVKGIQDLKRMLSVAFDNEDLLTKCTFQKNDLVTAMISWYFHLEEIKLLLEEQVHVDDFKFIDAISYDNVTGDTSLIRSRDNKLKEVLVRSLSDTISYELGLQQDLSPFYILDVIDELTNILTSTVSVEMLLVTWHLLYRIESLKVVSQKFDCIEEFNNNKLKARENQHCAAMALLLPDFRVDQLCNANTFKEVHPYVAIIKRLNEAYLFVDGKLENIKEPAAILMG